MINFDFEYRKPTTWEDAVNQFKHFKLQKKKVMYYAGGTEFISRARMNEVNPDVIIDIKGIPECQLLKVTKTEVVIGATVTLTEITESNAFPLLSSVVRGIATKTARNKITIGGNLMSSLPYKEGILPFLLAESKLKVATENGLETRNIADVFTNKINLQGEECIVQIITDASKVNQPFFTEKKTKQSRVNYPILTSASVHINDEMRVAFSGLCEFPFHVKEIDEELNNPSKAPEKRIKKIMKLLPGTILDDMHASQQYRKFVLERALTKIIEQMEGVSK